MTRCPVLGVVLVLASAGCSVQAPGTAVATDPPAPTELPAPTSADATDVPATTPVPSLVYPAPTTPTTEPPVAGPPVPAPVDPRAELARLAIDDQPNGAGYKRDLFMPGGKWQDPDRNGCDARRDALRAQAAPPITGPGCSTAGGRWPLVYVAGVTTNPADVDVDHVVPLSAAWRSGARTWSTDRLVAYAADPAILWVVDDGANQSKGDRGPEAWRPKERAVWCTYGQRWLSIKVTYGLTATTAERDAVGQLLQEC